MNSNIDNINSFLQRYNDSGTSTSNSPIEDPGKCVIMNDIDDYSIKSISTGEVCTIETAKMYGVFGKDKYFNNIIPKSEQSDINLYVNNSNNKLNYSLCSIDNNHAYQNCALSTRNPWKTINDTNKYCMLPIDITLPDKLMYNDVTKQIDKPPNIPLFQGKNKYCQEKWYDWFSIPDYHLGNVVFSDTSNNKCYSPCEIGALPNEDTFDKCIMKDKYQYGLYKSSFHYLPIAIIVLFGSTKEDLLKMHQTIMTYTRSEINKKGDLTMDYELYNNILTNERTRDNIFQDIRKDLKHHIQKLLSLPFDDTNIIPPNPNIQSLSANIMTKDRMVDAYEIAKKFHELSTNPDKTKEYYQWKKELTNINGFGLNDDKFFKQLLILKKACNVAFDNKTSYSKNTILYILNKDLLPTDPERNPIRFTITERDTILAVSSNSSQNTDKNQTISTSKDIVNKKFGLLYEENLPAIDNSGLDVNLQGIDPSKYDLDNKKYNASEQDDKKYYDKQKLLMIIIFVAILSVFFVTIIVILCYVMWPFVSVFINNLILGFIYMIYYIRDMFRGKYSPSRLNVEILDLQLSFLSKKIDADMVRDVIP